MGIFSSKTKFERVKKDYIQEKPTEQLIQEYQKKHPTMIQKWKQRRQEQQQKQQEMKSTLRAEYQKAYITSAKGAVRKKAHREAYEKYGRTPQQKQQNIGKAFSQIGDIFGTTPRPSTSSKRKGKTKTKKKHHPRDPFDMSGLSDIGDFDL